VVEGARLESVYTGNRIAGSNPAPSAKPTPERAVERTRRAAAARDAHHANQTDKVKRVAEVTIDDKTGEDWCEREDRRVELRECLKDLDDLADLGQRSIGEIIALICRDLGLTPDRQRWVDASWAKQEMGERPPGAPYAVWPPTRPSLARKAAPTRKPTRAHVPAPAPAPKLMPEREPASSGVRPAAALQLARPDETISLPKH
jgi:hypothetical protein